MPAHPLLDDPAWHALGGAHSHFGVEERGLRRYRPEFAGFIGSETPAARERLADFLLRGDLGVFMIPEPIIVPPGLELVLAGQGVQMVADRPTPLPVTVDIVQLGPADVPEVAELVELTQPGPFAARTIELGRYIGVREDGRLIAITGERMHPPGYTEVSAVCTHPDYRGRGLAGQLISAVMEGILSRGETPFLHTRAGNAGAIALYERLGYVLRTPVHFTVVKHIGGSEDDIPTFLKPH